MNYLINSILGILVLAGSSYSQDDKYTSERETMVKQQIEYRGITNQPTLKAMTAVPRHKFVPSNLIDRAYDDSPLPIGYGQTISQPYIVAYMTAFINLKSGQKVLEIGTGSGYQAAILSGLVKSVYSMEIIKPLATQAAARLQLLGFDNVTTRLSDGYYGWAEHGPFDAIVVTAAASHVPPYLVRQLRRGGRMVIPVGGRFLTQQLLLIEKTETGEVKTRQVIPVIFVPLTGEH